MIQQTKNQEKKNTTEKEEYKIPSKASIGHIHLKVSDVDRSLRFYLEVLGFDLIARQPNGRAAFISAGGYHHHIGLNSWESKDGDMPSKNSTGLYHFAILYPSRKDLAHALKRLLSFGISLDGASDHGISHALYLHDPDGNGIELAVDMPKEKWPRLTNGDLNIFGSRPLDLRSLLSEAD